MVEKSDSINLTHLKQSSKSEKRTLLPTIESGRRPSESLSEGNSKRASLLMSGRRASGSAPKSQAERNHTRSSQWEIHRSRTNGTTDYHQFDGLSSTVTFPAKPKKSQHRLSMADQHNKTTTEQKSSGKSKGRKSHNSMKLSMEPLQFPVVNLKSPGLPDLHSPRPTQQDGQTSNESWEPFSCVCKYCGLKFGKHSITIHEKKCSSSKQQGQPQAGLVSLQSNDSEFGDSTLSQVSRPQPVARIITIGLGSSPFDVLTISASLPLRPGTQTLQHSSLRDSGYGLPFVSSASDSQQTETDSGPSTHGMTLCDRCGRVVVSDQIKVHSRLCKPETHGKLNTSSVKFPSACNLLKVEQSKRLPKLSVKKPPTVVCYICGREYGTKSISIHEPQCLKKFEIENRRLPINKRKPLPKKVVKERAKVARFVSMEDEMVVVSGQQADPHPYKDLVDETMDFIFQQCYSDFERELVPCKRCGRKFTPDRHKIHEPNCNAKPLSGRIL